MASGGSSATSGKGGGAGLSPQFLQTLSSIAARNAQTPGFNPHSGLNPMGSGIAHLLLTQGPGFKQTSGTKPQGSPSVISRILDVLSRPLYAVGAAGYNAADAAANHQSFLDQLKALGGGAWQGLEGKEKVTPAQWIQQSHDINAQKDKTGSTQGYQPGEGNQLNLAEKIAGFGLNVGLDPLQLVHPIGIARSAGVPIPTLRQIATKGLSKLPAAQATKAALNEVTPDLGGISIPGKVPASAVAAGQSIPKQLAAKFGEAPPPLTPEELAHPLINSTIENGTIKSHGLTDLGQAAASQALKAHSDQMGTLLARINELKAAKLTKNNPEFDALKQEFKAGRKNVYPSTFAKQVENNSLDQLNALKESRSALQEAWAAKSAESGLGQSAARQIIEHLNSGRTFDEAVNSAVKPSTRIIQGSSLKKNSGLFSPSFRLGSVLKSAPKELLANLEAGSPQAKALVAAGENPTRAAALATPLGPKTEAIKNQVVARTINEIDRAGNFSSPVQANMWNTARSLYQKARSQIPGKTADQVEKINMGTMHIVAHAERDLEAMGHVPTTKHGTPAKISEAVANSVEFPHQLRELGTHLLENFVNTHPVGVASKVSKAISDSRVAEETIGSALSVANKIKGDPALSDPIRFLASQRTALGVQKAIMQLTGSSRAARTGRSIYNSIVTQAANSSQEALKNAGSLLEQIVMTGKIPENYGRIVADLGRGVSRDLGIQDPKLLGKLMEPYAQSEAGFLGRVATWMGQPDLRQAVLAGLGEARTNAARWANLYHDTFKGLKPEQRVEALRSAQGMFEPVNPAIAAASEAIRTRMENLFSASGLSNAAVKGETQAFRSGLTQRELNLELGKLGSDFRFTNGKAKNLLGEEIDYSKGADWLKSWEAHKLTGRPEKFLAQLEAAVFNAMSKRSLYQEMIDRFGSFSKNAEQTIQLRNFPQLAGHYFHPEISQQIQRVNRDLFKSGEYKSNDFLRKLDTIMRIWKTHVTIYSPSHSIHNGMGDIYNSWAFGGVRDPRVYYKALSVMRAHSADYKSFEKMAPYINSETLPGAIAKSVPTSRIVTRTADGQPISAAQIYMAAHQNGILQSARDIEDLGFGSLPNFQPFGGRVHDVAHGAVQNMDHFTRLAHFIDAVSKSRGSLSAVFKDAANQVRRIHPDGMDLTDFERNVVRRVIPFYSWSRKTIPFMLYGMMQRPSKFMIYPKATYAAVQNQPGTTLSQQFPTDQLFPGWIQDLGIGPIGGPSGVLNSLAGQPSAYVESSLSVPPMDVLQSYHNPLQGILGQLNPLIKAPIELNQGTTVDTGIPTGGTLQYVGGQLPGLSILQRLSNVGLGGVTTKGQNQGIGNAQAIANYFSGLKLINTGNYVKEANYEKRQQQKAGARTNAALILAQIKAAQQSAKG